MVDKTNSLKLNPLQLRTLGVLQILTQVPGMAQAGPGDGEVTINRFPQAHGDHIHIGNYALRTKDATGLYNEAVWNALTRKGVARADWPRTITLTREGAGYETGLLRDLLQAPPH